MIRFLYYIGSMLFITYFFYTIMNKWHNYKVEQFQTKVNFIQNDIAILESSSRNLYKKNPLHIDNSEILWFAPSKQNAELDLQNKISLVAKDLDITFTTFGSSLLNNDNDDIIYFNFEAESDLNKVYILMNKLEEISPRVAIKSLSIRANSRDEPENTLETTVFIQGEVWAFWKVYDE